MVFAFTFAFHSVQFKFHLGLSYFKVIKYGEYYSEYKSVALRMPNAFRFSDKHERDGCICIYHSLIRNCIKHLKEIWLDKAKYTGWFSRHKNKIREVDKTHAYCKHCKSAITLSNMGIGA